MLHAAALFSGCFVVWLLLTQRWSSAEDLTLAGAASLAVVIIAWRFGGVGGAFWRAPALGLISLSRAGVVARGAVATLRAALAADITLQPALVRVKTRASGAAAQAAFADAVGAAPGAIVVEADDDGLLVHVNDEDGVDAVAIGALEARVLGAVGAETTS